MNYKQNTKCYLTSINKQEASVGRRERNTHLKVIQMHGSKGA